MLRFPTRDEINNVDVIDALEKTFENYKVVYGIPPKEEALEFWSQTPNTKRRRIALHRFKNTEESISDSEA